MYAGAAAPESVAEPDGEAKAAYGDSDDEPEDDDGGDADNESQDSKGSKGQGADDVYEQPDDAEGDSDQEAGVYACLRRSLIIFSAYT